MPASPPSLPKSKLPFTSSSQVSLFIICMLMFSTIIGNETVLYFSLKNYSGSIYSNQLLCIIGGTLAVFFSYSLISSSASVNPAHALTVCFTLTALSTVIYPQVAFIANIFGT